MSTINKLIIGSDFKSDEISEKTTSSGVKILNILKTQDGTCPAPSIAFDSQNDLGIYRDAANTIGFAACAAQPAMTISDTKIVTNKVIQAGDGTGGNNPAAPVYAFENQIDAGMYRADVDTLGFASNGAEQLTISNTEITTDKVIRADDGSGGNNPAVPVYSFKGQTDAGMFLSDTDTLGFSTGGVERVTMSTSSMETNLSIALNETKIFSGFVSVPVSHTWADIAWSPTLNLAVAVGNNADRIITSSNLADWTVRTSPEANAWTGVVWSPSLSLFCAVSTNGTNRAMTSPDGINWTGRTTSLNQWYSVEWSPTLSLFCSSSFGTVMETSPDGINWTSRTITIGFWSSITWSPLLSLFCTVSQAVATCATSPDGITWTSRPLAAGLWQDVKWSTELSIFVTSASGGNVQTSADGITWVAQTVPVRTWGAIATSPFGIFIFDGDGSSNYLRSTNGTVWNESASGLTIMFDGEYISELGVIVMPGTSSIVRSDPPEISAGTITAGSIDTKLAQTLTIAPSNASKVEIADTGVVTEVKGSLSVDVIIEKTGAAGVTIDGVLIKDGLVDGVDVSTIPTGKVDVAGDTMTGDLTLDTKLLTDTIDEKTGAAGVTIDGVLIKDGLVDGVDVSTIPTSLNGKVDNTGDTMTGDLTLDTKLLTDTIDEKTGDTGVTVDGVLIKDGLVDGVDVADFAVLPTLPSMTMVDYDQKKVRRYFLNKFANADGKVVEYTHGATVVQFGYWGGVYSPWQNRIYLVPRNQADQTTWHYIDCDTGSVVGYVHGLGTLPVNAAYYGGIFSPTQNRIYLVPDSQSNVDTWHYIDCDDGSVVGYVHGFGTGITANAYRGGVYCSTLNRIYLVPYGISNVASWHYIDCNDGSVNAYVHGFGTGISFNGYEGGVYSPPQDRIYFIPSSHGSSNLWHYINCSTGTVVQYDNGFTPPVLASTQYIGGVYSPTQNRIYFIPGNNAHTSSSWHYIDCSDGSLQTYVHGQPLDTSDSYSGGAFSPSENRIYMAQQRSTLETTWIYIDCNTGSIETYTHGITEINNMYAGAVYSPSENRTYFVPYSQADQTEWHYIQDLSNASISKSIMAGPIFNKF